LLIAAAAFVVALVTVPLTSRLAVRHGAVVRPREDRWSREVVPILGGLAVVAAVISVAWLILDDGSTLVAWLICLIGLSAIGLMDDLSGIRPRYRLLAEALLGSGFAVVVFDGIGPVPRLAAGLAGMVVVIILTNATNLVDNTDGLAASLSAETALGIALTAAVAGMKGNEAALSLALAGACLGFLVHNLPPARVFMGDAGSLMIGFAISGAALLLVHDAMIHPSARATAAALALPVTCLVQLGDVAMVSVTRIRRGVSPFVGGTDHTSHRLVRAGLGSWGMLGTLTAASGACGAVAIVLAWRAPQPIVTVAVVVVAGLAVLAFEAWVAMRFPFSVETPAESASPLVQAPIADGQGGLG
jgi:UDP-GlcNAc:undecaprenyl-phosphate GlcNAc-1-phosphate transferase